MVSTLLGVLFFGQNAVKMNLKTTQLLLKYRDFLQSISQISFSFSTLNKQYPISGLSNTDGRGLIQSYSNLVRKAKQLSDQFENEYEENTNI